MQSINQYRKIHRTVQSISQLESQIVGDSNVIGPKGSTGTSKQGHELESDARICAFTNPVTSASHNTQQVVEGDQRTYGSKDCAKGMHDLEKVNIAAARPYIVVNFDDDCDPLNPQNWSYGYKWMVTGAVSLTSFIVTGASAIDSEIAPQLMQDFGVREEVALLGTALFMIAFGLGSLISAPFSEILGRNPVYIVSMLQYVSVSLPSMLR